MSNERELLIKKLLQHTLSEQVEKLKRTDEADQSFIYLEGESIHLLLMYLLMSIDGKEETKRVSAVDDTSKLEALCKRSEKISLELDKLLKEYS